MLNRPKQDRQPRDWVRVKPGEKAAAVPEKPEYDDDRLLKLLQSSKRELQGLRLVHLHLSLLQDKNYGDVHDIRRTVQSIADNSAFLQMFNLSNGDALILYKGIKFSTITEACQKIETMMLARTKLTGPNPYRENSLYSIMELSLNFATIIRFIEGLAQQAGGADGSAKAATKEPISLEELAKIERQMGNFDLSPFMLNQPIVDIRDDQNNRREYFEIYIAVKNLEDRLSPEFDLTANRWLFNYFTASLDQAVLKSLNHGVDFIRGHKIGLNVNLSTIMSAAFVRFDERLSMDLRGNVVLEINKVDLVENIETYKEVVEFARNRGYSICIDGITPMWVEHMDLEYMACDYAKMFWSNELQDMDEAEQERFGAKIRDQENCRFILGRCSGVTALLFARKHGIHLVQGRMVDNILRKGVRLSDALNTANVLETDD
jgi:EAL domain-containing protein (putative c-di-GMP-specific phosphodiesterase class I)